jgi:hypothetical protein
MPNVCLNITLMRGATFTTIVISMLIPASCTEDQTMKALETKARTDNLELFEDRGDLDLDLDISPEFLSRKEELKLNLITRVQPDVEELVVLGKEKMATYGIDPTLVSLDPNDPQFALMGLLIDQLELLYANGYAIEFVDGPVVNDTPEALTGVSTCLVDATGLGGVVRIVQDGAKAAGITGRLVIGTFVKLSSRAVIGWIGAGIVAWELGTCLAKANFQIPFESLSEAGRRKRMKELMDNLTHTKQDFEVVFGDTATHIFREEDPFMMPHK